LCKKFIGILTGSVCHLVCAIFRAKLNFNVHFDLLRREHVKREAIGQQTLGGKRGVGLDRMALVNSIGLTPTQQAMGGWGFALHCAILPQSSRPAP
jgi:hypothetical protein